MQRRESDRDLLKLTVIKIREINSTDSEMLIEILRQIQREARDLLNDLSNKYFPDLN